MGSIIRSTRTVFYSLSYLNSRQGCNGLKYLCPVISVKMERLPGNTRNQLFTRSWTARVRLVHSWAGCADIVHNRFKIFSSANRQYYMSNSFGIFISCAIPVCKRSCVDIVHNRYKMFSSANHHMGWLRIVGSIKL